MQHVFLSLMVHPLFSKQIQSEADWVWSGWSWLLSLSNDIPNGMFCLTSLLVLHSTTCGYVCIHQQVGQSNTMKEDMILN